MRKTLGSASSPSPLNSNVMEIEKIDISEMQNFLIKFRKIIRIRKPCLNWLRDELERFQRFDERDKLLTTLRRELLNFQLDDEVKIVECIDSVLAV